MRRLAGEVDVMRLLKISEVAARLGVSRSFAYELAASRAIPTIVLGHAIRVPEAELEQWLKERVELNQEAAVPARR